MSPGLDVLNIWQSQNGYTVVMNIGFKIHLLFFWLLPKKKMTVFFKKAIKPSTKIVHSMSPGAVEMFFFICSTWSKLYILTVLVILYAIECGNKAFYIFRSP